MAVSITNCFSVVVPLGARTAQSICDAGLSALKSIVKDRLSGGGRRSGSSGGGRQVNGCMARITGY